MSALPRKGEVRDRLQAPATASFPDFFDGDGDVRVSHSGDEMLVRSQVDAQNGFGATLRAPWVCSLTIDTAANTYRTNFVTILE